MRNRLRDSVKNQDPGAAAMRSRLQDASSRESGSTRKPQRRDGMLSAITTPGWFANPAHELISAYTGKADHFDTGRRVGF